MTEHTYTVIEVPYGWRVCERNSNGDKVHTRLYKTEAAALDRAVALTTTQRTVNAGKGVRRRAGHRCECIGECNLHFLRCTVRTGDVAPAGLIVELAIIALDHDRANLDLANLRAYCQLCRQYHDADEAGEDPMFDLTEWGTR